MVLPLSINIDSYFICLNLFPHLRNGNNHNFLFIIIIIHQDNERENRLQALFRLLYKTDLLLLYYCCIYGLKCLLHSYLSVLCSHCKISSLKIFRDFWNVANRIFLNVHFGAECPGSNPYSETCPSIWVKWLKNS